MTGNCHEAKVFSTLLNCGYSSDEVAKDKKLTGFGFKIRFESLKFWYKTRKRADSNGNRPCYEVYNAGGLRV